MGEILDLHENLVDSTIKCNTIKRIKDDIGNTKVPVSVEYDYVNSLLYSSITELDSDGVTITSFVHGTTHEMYHIKYELLTITKLNLILNLL